MRPAALLLLALLSGCDRLSPGDSIYLFGRLTGPDGLAASELTLEVEVSEAGLDPERPEFAPLTQVTTASDGYLALELAAADAWGPRGDGFGPVNRLRLRPQDPESGLSVTLEMTGDAELPPLQLGTLRAELGEGLELSYALPPALVLPSTASGHSQDPARPNPTLPVPVLEISAGGHRAWLEWRPGQGASVTTLLEDFAAPTVKLRAVSGGAWSHDPLLAPNLSAVWARFEWRTSLKPSPGLRVPTSRGAGCGPVPCPWTDGLLDPVAFQAGTRELQLTLQGEVVPHEVVLRGLQLASYGVAIRIEGHDGASWLPLADVPITFPELPLEVSRWPADSPWDAPVPQFDGRYYLRVPVTAAAPLTAIRLSAPDGAGGNAELAALQELSLFGREP